jgi:hypothetical protein
MIKQLVYTFLKNIQGGQVAKNLSRKAVRCIAYIGIVSLKDWKDDGLQITFGNYKALRKITIKISKHI